MISSNLTDLHFGCAFDTLSEDCDFICACLSLDNFTTAEIPADFFLNPHARNSQLVKDARGRGMDLCCGSIFDKSSSAYVPYENKDICVSFSNYLNKMLEKLAENGIKTVPLMCYIDRIVQNNSALEHLKYILTHTAKTLLKDDMKILLPVAIPDSDIAGCFKFFRDIMLPCIKARLDVFPDKMSINKPVKDFAGYMNMETECVVIHYNADSGYLLSEKRITPLLQYMMDANYHGKILFAPHSREKKVSLKEFVRLNDLVGKLLNDAFTIQ